MNWGAMFLQDWQGLARTAVVGVLAYVTLVVAQLVLESDGTISAALVGNTTGRAA